MKWLHDPKHDVWRARKDYLSYRISPIYHERYLLQLVHPNSNRREVLFFGPIHLCKLTAIRHARACQLVDAKVAEYKKQNN